MISGIGIDIVHVDRIRRWMNEPGILKRFFHPAEIETASLRKKGAALSLGLLALPQKKPLAKRSVLALPTSH